MTLKFSSAKKNEFSLLIFFFSLCLCASVVGIFLRLMRMPGYPDEEMTIMKNFDLYKYSLPLYLPAMKRREGVLVHAQGKDGKDAWAEVSPLPGWSRETLEEAVAQLKNPTGDLYPSVAFALESIEAQLSTQCSPFSLPLSGLLIGSSEEVLKKAKQMKKDGFKTVKLKVAHLAEEEARDLIDELKKDFTLRVDVNRAWDLKQAVQFFSRYDQTVFDYIEDPLKDRKDLIHFPFPIALDEDLHEQDLGLPHLKAIIVKPTITHWAPVLEIAKKKGINFIMTGAFETGVGIFNIARLCKSLGLTEFPIGCDTYRYMPNILKEPLKIADGRMHFPADVEPLLEKL